MNASSTQKLGPIHMSRSWFKAVRKINWITEASQREPASLDCTGTGPATALRGCGATVAAARCWRHWQTSKQMSIQSRKSTLQWFFQKTPYYGLVGVKNSLISLADCYNLTCLRVGGVPFFCLDAVDPFSSLYSERRQGSVLRVLLQ